MSILPHNIVNDTRWRQTASDEWYCTPSQNIGVHLFKRRGGYIVKSFGVTDYLTADSLPAAKAEALRLVREAVLAEAEAWK